jgi:hypothetical protein
VYNKTVPDDDFIKLKHVVIKTQVFLLVVLTDKIKSIYTIHHRMPKYRLLEWKMMMKNDNHNFYINTDKGKEYFVNNIPFLNIVFTKINNFITSPSVI